MGVARSGPQGRFLARAPLASSSRPRSSLALMEAAEAPAEASGRRGEGLGKMTIPRRPGQKAGVSGPAGGPGSAPGQQVRAEGSDGRNSKCALGQGKACQARWHTGASAAVVTSVLS